LIEQALTSLRFTSMKMIFYILMVTFALSCSKEEKIEICNTDEPLEQISWLKSIVQSIMDNGSPSEVVVFVYKGNDVFLINPCMGCADGLTTVYDCNGNEICKFGGFAGFNTCPDFDQTAVEKAVLFRKN